MADQAGSHISDFSFENLIPSKTSHVYWIYAQNKTNRNNERPKDGKCGKWLVFRKLEEIDETWEKIKIATENGELGHGSKVRAATVEATGSTASADSRNWNEGTKVICVYTKDWTDKEDVDRVREALRNIGINERIHYKTDEDTRAGKYRHTGHKKVSKYSA